MIDQRFNRAIIIGAGNLAHSLLPALLSADINVIQVISRTLESAELLALENDIDRYSNSLSDFDDSAEIIFLAVPDSEINPVAENISLLEISFPQKIFVHHSGVKTIDELSPLTKKDAVPASLHIMHSFPNRTKVPFNKYPVAIEVTEKRVESRLSGLCEKMNLVPFPLKSEAKAYYHLMGVFGINFINANFYNAEKLKANINSEVPEAGTLLSNAALETLKNIKQSGSIKSLSGPVERGDLSSIMQHIESLQDDNLLLLNYIVLSLTLTETAKEKKSISSLQYSAIKSYLKEQLKIISSRYLNS